MKDEGSAIFGFSRKHEKENQEQEIAKLYQRIGQLTTEIEFLKKVVES